MSVTSVRSARYARPLTLFLIALLIRPAVAAANDVTPPAPPPPRTPIVGFIDTHLHQFANLGFGGLEVWGSPMDPTLDTAASPAEAAARALPDSDFIYVPLADAPDYLGLGGMPAGYDTVPCPDGSGMCARITLHGPGGGNDLLNQMIPNGSSSHGVMGYPDMDGWPAFDVLTTQQAYWEWLERAHANGLKMIVMLAVNNSVLCQLALHIASYGCGDDGAVERQIQGAKDLQAYIDARSGGAGEGFYRIVYSSEEARTAIQNNKLAVVLGTEVDTAWGCTTGSGGCSDADIQDRVQDYYDAGIRVVYPVHLIDNKFGGAAVYNGLFEINSFLVNGGWFSIAPCGPPIEWRSDIRQTISDLQVGVVIAIAAMFLLGPLILPALEFAAGALMLAFPVFAMVLPLLGAVLPGLAPIIGIGGSLLVAAAAIFIVTMPGAVGAAADGNCNTRTLTSEGETLIHALMDRKMIIDVDHTDTPTFDAILSIAESRTYPGIVAGHTGLIGSSLTRAELGGSFVASDSGRHEANKTDAQVQRVLDVGGFVAIGLNGGGRHKTRDYDGSDGIAFDCGRSSQALAQVYLHATKQLGLSAVGIGSDINGFAGLPAPRFGAKACAGDMAGGYDPNSASGRLDYATATNYFGAPLTRYTFGGRTWDFNVDGFANVGLYPDLIADLRAINVSQADLAPLFNGVEAYVRMWEKAMTTRRRRFAAARWEKRGTPETSRCRACRLISAGAWPTPPTRISR